MNSYLIIIVVVFALAAIFALLKKNLLAAGLWVVIGLGTYLLTDSIMAPIKFQEVRDARYSKVFKSLEAIGDVEKLYRTSNNRFAASFDELYAFMDTAKVYLTQTREVSYKEYSKVYRIDIMKEKKVVDTVAVVSVLEHLRNNYEKFAAYEKAHNGYKDLRYVPVQIEGQPKTEFAISAGEVERGKNTVPVFEVSVKKNVILSDQDSDLLANENAAVVGVKGDIIKLGDMTVPTTEGNWGKEAK